MQEYSKELQEVERLVKANARSLAAGNERQLPIDVYKTGYDVYWVPVPKLRSLVKAGFSFDQKDGPRIHRIMRYVWENAKSIDVLSIPLFYYEEQVGTSDSLKLWERTKSFASDLENWAHSDILSKIYAAALEDNFNKVYPTLLKWNTSAKPWLRRQSIVSLLYYANSRKKRIPKYNQMIPLVESLLEDKHYYVQKGVGWTLRELGNVYPKQTAAFIKRNILRLSPIAFSSSTEKWTAEDKAPLKLKRKEFRKKNGIKNGK